MEEGAEDVVLLFCYGEKETDETDKLADRGKKGLEMLSWTK
jgi:hypothetical protein